MLEGPALGFLLTTLAGLTTAIGSLSVFFVKVHNKEAFLICLSISAAAMLYVSFLELMVECEVKFFNHYVKTYPEKQAKFYAGYLRPCTFFVGWFATSIISFITNQLLDYQEKRDTIIAQKVTVEPSNIPTDIESNDLTQKNVSNPAAIKSLSYFPTVNLKDNPPANSNDTLVEYSMIKKIQNVIFSFISPPASDHRSAALKKFSEDLFEFDQKQFVRIGVINTVVLCLHNIPEGVASYVGSLERPSFGIGLAFAIAFHNIPEGFAVAVPLYYGTNSRWKAFFFSTLTGLAEPLGALLAYGFIKSAGNQYVFAWTLGVTAGVMTNIAIVELLSTAVLYDLLNRLTSCFFVFGMFLIAFTITGVNTQ